MFIHHPPRLASVVVVGYVLIKTPNPDHKHAQDEFRSFMLHANPKTRRQNQTAGESVDVEGYLRKMADNATDGDHLTLQVGPRPSVAVGRSVVLTDLV